MAKWLADRMDKVEQHSDDNNRSTQHDLRAWFFVDDTPYPERRKRGFQQQEKPGCIPGRKRFAAAGVIARIAAFEARNGRLAPGRHAEKHRSQQLRSLKRRPVSTDTLDP
ncbi:hypothetical protein IV454_02605 [Massilia antarctica]|uniref:Transposase n=1 Tax=Massilia antarctica TaxID=2765360 RepID=A0AA48WFZ5_9BURK|nr:hypothetical protein [Massilia antarctica]QPI50530.1 hypothetical protein IV454_02605 [Massilia antarctica]